MSLLEAISKTARALLHPKVTKQIESVGGGQLKAEFLVKAVNHDRALRVHASSELHRPVCGGGPRGKSIIAWQLDPGPANCKRCLKILAKKSQPKEQNESSTTC